MNKENFIKYVNQIRKENKNKWYVCTKFVDGKLVEIKAFNTWLQIFKVDGLQQDTLMDISVKQFNETLERAL